jgi:hypothetical protein
VRAEYEPFESGMKSGTARVFDHQIPGGQYSNLLVQCTSMGLQGEQWNAVLDAYRDVNLLFGDIVKVTPSSKVVGDLALYLVLKGLTTRDLIDPVTNTPVPGASLLDFPESVVGLMKGELGTPCFLTLWCINSHSARYSVVIRLSAPRVPTCPDRFGAQGQQQRAVLHSRWPDAASRRLREEHRHSLRQAWCGMSFEHK